MDDRAADRPERSRSPPFRLGDGVRELRLESRRRRPPGPLRRPARRGEDALRLRLNAVRVRHRGREVDDEEVETMRIAWFIHRYYPCVGGAENYGRAMVRRFVAAGHEVDVLTSDAHDLWYFTNKAPEAGRRAGRVDGRRRPGPAVRGQASPAPALLRPAPELRPALADPLRRRVVHADPARDRPGPGRL